MAPTQQNRYARVFSPLPDDQLLLTRLSGEETLSGLYRFDLELVSPPADDGTPTVVSFDEVIGQALTVEITDADAEPRYFHGIVSRFGQKQETDGFTFYEAEIVPWAWLLTRNTRCRIFEDQSASDIAKAVFGDLPTSDVLWDGKSGSGETRLHTVQYRESDLDFVARLLQGDHRSVRDAEARRAE